MFYGAVLAVCKREYLSLVPLLMAVMAYLDCLHNLMDEDSSWLLVKGDIGSCSREDVVAEVAEALVIGI